jgi:NAD(P)H-dependent flavin oxidoreductase YrpB (nitropropane dioxygenase family)
MSRLPKALQNLSLPVIGAPLFIISNPKLVIEQCKAGVIGAMPALNARPAAQLDEWLHEITETLAAWNRDHPEQPAAPFAINQIVHKSNDRLAHDMEVVVKYKVPVVITSLGARTDVNEAIHSYGGVVLHDIINNAFAHKAIEKGADGLIAVAAGAGGASGSTARSHCPARSPAAAPCWRRRRWARISRTSARPSSRRTRRGPARPTSRPSSTATPTRSSTRTFSRACTATT